MKLFTRHPMVRVLAATTTAASMLLIAGCAGQAPDTETDQAAIQSGIDEDFDLDELIAAAQEEGPITIYDNASAVEDMADAFSEKYGIEATGQKVGSAEGLEMVQREAESGNVVADVIAIPDVPAVNNQLIPNDFVYSWVPADLAEDIEESQQDPLVVIHDPNYWSYNTAAHGVCPVDNLWQLTEEDWGGRVALEDPVGANKLLDWFSQMEQFADDELADSYEDHYGEALESDQESATREWVARLAANNPILTSSNEDVSEAIGAPGQGEEAPMGLMASSKFRNVEELGYEHGVCEGLDPWVGSASPKSIVIATNSESPNAAKLFVHFAMTQEGISPQINDGKISANSAIDQPEDPSDTRGNRDDLFYFDNAGVDTDWTTRQDWQDHWRVSAR